MKDIEKLFKTMAVKLNSELLISQVKDIKNKYPELYTSYTWMRDAIVFNKLLENGRIPYNFSTSPEDLMIQFTTASAQEIANCYTKKQILLKLIIFNLKANNPEGAMALEILYNQLDCDKLARTLFPI